MSTRISSFTLRNLRSRSQRTLRISIRAILVLLSIVVLARLLSGCSQPDATTTNSESNAPTSRVTQHIELPFQTQGASTEPDATQETATYFTAIPYISLTSAGISSH